MVDVKHPSPKPEPVKSPSPKLEPVKSPSPGSPIVVIPEHSPRPTRRPPRVSGPHPSPRPPLSIPFQDIIEQNLYGPNYETFPSLDRWQSLADASDSNLQTLLSNWGVPQERLEDALEYLRSWAVENVRDAAGSPSRSPEDPVGDLLDEERRERREGAPSPQQPVGLGIYVPPQPVPGTARDTARGLVGAGAGLALGYLYDDVPGAVAGAALGYAAGNHPTGSTEPNPDGPRLGSVAVDRAVSPALSPDLPDLNPDDPPDPAVVRALEEMAALTPEVTNGHLTRARELVVTGGGALAGRYASATPLGPIGGAVVGYGTRRILDAAVDGAERVAIGLGNAMLDAAPVQFVGNGAESIVSGLGSHHRIGTRVTDLVGHRRLRSTGHDVRVGGEPYRGTLEGVRRESFAQRHNHQRQSRQSRYRNARAEHVPYYRDEDSPELD